MANLYKNERDQINKENKDFVKAKYNILRNPTNMNNYHRKELRKVLKLFPYLRPIRNAIVKFHYQFKVSESGYQTLNFLQNIVESDSHKKLKSAIATLIKEEDSIFIYREILEKHPNLKKGKSIRSNHEQINI